MPNRSNLFHVFALLFISLFCSTVSTSAKASEVADELKSCYDFVKSSEYSRSEELAKSLLARYSHRQIQFFAFDCLSVTYRKMGRSQDALNAMLEEEKLAETIKDLASVYHALGDIYSDLDDLDRAELNSQRAIKAYRNLSDKRGEARSLAALALVAQKRGDLKQALAINYQVLKLIPDDEKGIVLSNIAGIHNERHEYAKSTKVMRQALDIVRQAGDPEMTAIMQVNLGASLRDQGKFAESEKELMAGYNTLHLMKSKGWEAKACGHLASLAMSKNDNALAAEWWTKNKALRIELGEVTE